MKKNQKNLAIIMLSILTLLNFSGCSNSKNKDDDLKGNYPVKVSSVEFSKPPEKVVVLSQSLADIIIAQGFDMNLVAASSDCTQKELEILPKLGIGENIDIQSMLNMSPDLILVDHALTDDQIKPIKDAKVNILILKNATNRDEFETLYTDLGSIFAGKKTGFEKGAKTAKNILMTLDDIERLTKNETIAKTACYLYNTDGAVASNDTFSGQLIEYAGAINIAKDVKNSTMTPATIKISDPDYVFCAQGLKQKILSDEILSQLDAVKNNKVFEMDLGLMDRQGKTVIKATTFMAGIMYPELTSKGNTSTSNNKSSSNEESSSSTVNSSSSQETTQASTSPIDSSIVLSYGDKGDNVLKLETRLNELGYMPKDPDGIFDDDTKRAVTDFQYLNHSYTTGIADQDTISLLFSESAIKRDQPYR